METGSTEGLTPEELLGIRKVEEYLALSRVEDMNLERVLMLYERLEEYLKKYGDNSILHSYKIVQRTVLLLKSKETNDVKESYVIQSYKSLYPGRGALSEFYIWDTDKERRKSLNEPLDAIHNELWEMIRDFI